MNDKLQDKMMKILSLLDGAKTEGEAMAALNRATKLLEGVGMTLDEFKDKFGESAEESPERVEIQVTDSALILPGKKTIGWYWSAIHTVCDVCNLNFAYRALPVTFRIDGNDKTFQKFVVVGTNDSLVSAARMLDSLVNTVYPNCINTFRSGLEYSMLPDAATKRLYSKDFSLGFWLRLSARAKEMREKRSQESRLRLANDWQGETSLVRATDIIKKRTNEMIQRHTNVVKARVKLVKQSCNAKIHSDGYTHGKNAANGVDLYKPSNQKRIG